MTCTNLDKGGEEVHTGLCFHLELSRVRELLRLERELPEALLLRLDARVLSPVVVFVLVGRRRRAGLWRVAVRVRVCGARRRRALGVAALLRAGLLLILLVRLLRRLLARRRRSRSWLFVYP